MLSRHHSTHYRVLVLSTAMTLSYLVCSPVQSFGSSEGTAPERVSTNDVPNDPDFQVQGEYQGRFRLKSGRLALYAFQVIAKGDGQFEGLLFRGGFPGTGWNSMEKITFTGGVSESRVELSADDFDLAATMDMSQTHQWNFSRTSTGKSVGSLFGITRQSPTLGATPPDNATLLFVDGQVGRLNDARVTEDGLLNVGFTTTDAVRDFQLHVEFRTPWEPNAAGQGRGNSGVYIQRRYEVQVLDSFGLAGAANECGGLYRQREPDHNMALPPMSWQTYDIDFRAARFDEQGNKTQSAVITVRHNGVVIHDQYEIVAKTGAGRPEGPEAMPIHFQDHSNPVNYRNLWMVTMDDSAVAASSSTEQSTNDVASEQHITTTCTPIDGHASVSSGSVRRFGMPRSNRMRRSR